MVGTAEFLVFEGCLRTLPAFPLRHLYASEQLVILGTSFASQV